MTLALYLRSEAVRPSIHVVSISIPGSTQSYSSLVSVIAPCCRLDEVTHAHLQVLNTFPLERTVDHDPSSRDALLKVNTKGFLDHAPGNTVCHRNKNSSVG